MGKSKTKNQHYVSQAEQRLNASDPAVPNRIYEFDVTNRDVPALSLRNRLGKSIRKSLSFIDLFSFDVVDSEYRHNLEKQFNEYEQNITTHSNSLLQKLQSSQDEVLKPEVVELFAAKLLAFMRNPNCITKVLNTIGSLTEFRPTDPQLTDAFEQVRRGSRPQSEAVCKEFGLTTDAYDRWLHALFLLLARFPKQDLDVFGSITKQLFESHYVLMQVYYYTDQDPQNVCLLSDRSFNQLPGDEARVFAFEFNVTARAFARFSFCVPDAFAPCAPSQLQHQVASRLKGIVEVCYVTNDLGSLVTYNQRTAYQCAARVYAANPDPRLHL